MTDSLLVVDPVLYSRYLPPSYRVKQAGIGSLVATHGIDGMDEGAVVEIIENESELIRLVETDEFIFSQRWVDDRYWFDLARHDKAAIASLIEAIHRPR